MNLKPIKKMIVVGTAAAAVVNTIRKRLETNAIKAIYNLPDSFTVTAHTGCNGTQANTLEGLKAAIETGADIVEIDVLDDENGTVILSHDYESGKECPTFEDALKLVMESSDTVKVNVDIKRRDASFAADEIIRSLGMTDRCFFTGIYEQDVQAIAATVSVPYYINIRPSLTERNSEEFWIKTASKVNMLGAVGINCNFRIISGKGVEICKKNSLLVSLFTPDSADELNFALTLSPDNITTRNPEYIISKRSGIK